MKDSIAAATQIARSHHAGAFHFATDAAQMADLWSARKVALWASLAVRPEGTEIWSTDVAVPLSSMAEIMGMIPCHDLPTMKLPIRRKEVASGY